MFFGHGLPEGILWKYESRIKNAMKKFAFKLNGISEAVLGRVTATPDNGRGELSLAGGSIGILLNNHGSEYIDFYNISADALPLKDNEGSVLDFNLGDVVLFNPSGTCAFEYQSRYSSNCLLLTERCNCKCIMCAQPPKVDSDCTALAGALVELIDTPPECIGITGGEPTLVWNELIKVLQRCRERFPAMEIREKITTLIMIQTIMK